MNLQYYTPIHGAHVMSTVALFVYHLSPCEIQFHWRINRWREKKPNPDQNYHNNEIIFKMLKRQFYTIQTETSSAIKRTYVVTMRLFWA